MKYPSAVCDRRGQTIVAIVATLIEIKLSTHNPPVDPGAQAVLPREWPGGLRLVLPVHQHRVVSACSAQASAFAAVADIFECSRIDQQVPSIPNQADAQRIRVPSPPIPRP